MSTCIDWSGAARQPCPQCGRGPKDRTCSVKLDGRGGVAHCFRCGCVVTSRGEVQAGKALPPRFQHETLSPIGRALWDACRPLGGDAAAYLQARACVLPPDDGHLRWHPALRHPPSGMRWPALVGLVTDAITGVPLTLHRTWVRADGTKAPLDPPRLLLGHHRKAGGVVRLWGDEFVTEALGVTEGIESGLSLAQAFKPVWAALDAGNLGALPLVPGVQTLLIGADHDDAGLRAADACAMRWRRGGVDVRVVVPPLPGQDLNDVVRGDST